MISSEACAVDARMSHNSGAGKELASTTLFVANEVIESKEQL